MKSAINLVFDRLRAAGHCAFIPYITAGFPDFRTCLDLLRALCESGADIIEVGVPVPDPPADGPTIRWAGRKALDNGMTPARVFQMAELALTRIQVPLVLMAYCQTVFAMGSREFAARARDAGISGVIVPDLPVEQAGKWLEAADSHGLDTILPATPDTSPERMSEIVSLTKGFLYCVSTRGPTGCTLTLSEGLFQRIRDIRGLADIPVAVGFGVSTSKQARELSRVADGVIVGTEIIRTIGSADVAAEQIAAAARLALSLSTALKTGKHVNTLRATRQGGTDHDLDIG